MKMTSDQFDALKALITPVDTPETRAKYLAGDFPRADAVKDLDRRYRWDLFWSVRGHTVLPDSEYLDSHVDTALRRIVPPLGNG